MKSLQIDIVYIQHVFHVNINTWQTKPIHRES